jgi:hypothetical protein
MIVSIDHAAGEQHTDTQLWIRGATPSFKMQQRLIAI